MAGNCVGARDETRDAVGTGKVIDHSFDFRLRVAAALWRRMAVAPRARRPSHTTMEAAGGGGGDDGGTRVWLLTCTGSHACATVAAAVAAAAAAAAAMRVHT